MASIAFLSLEASPWSNTFSFANAFKSSLVLIPNFKNSNPFAALKIFFKTGGYLFQFPILIRYIRKNVMKNGLCLLMLLLGLAACTNNSGTTVTVKTDSI